MRRIILSWLWYYFYTHKYVCYFSLTQLHERWISWFLASLKVVANYEIISRVNCKTHWLLLYVAAEHLTHWTYISLSRYYTIFHSTMWYIHISTYVDCSILGWECLTHIFLSHSLTHLCIKYSTACVSPNISVLLWPTVLIYHYILYSPDKLIHTMCASQYIRKLTTVLCIIFALYMCIFLSLHTTGTSARVRIRAKLKHISQRSAIIETNQDSLSNGEWSGK